MRKSELVLEQEGTCFNIHLRPDTAQGTGGEKSTIQGGDNEVPKQDHEPPCRIEITLHGLEWFVYNRSAAYDAILSGFRVPKRNHNNDATQTSPAEKAPHTSTGEVDKHGSTLHANQPNSSSRQENFPPDPSPVSDPESPLELPKFLSMLPIWVNCSKGALVAGNEHAKSIFTMTFEKGSGKIDAGASGTLDIYKQIFDFELLHPVIRLKPNPDFKQSQLAAAKPAVTEDDDGGTLTRPRRLFHAYQRRRQKLWHGLRNYVPYFRTSVESFQTHYEGSAQHRPSRQFFDISPGEPRWVGLTRYLDEESRNEHEGWNAVEYGRFSTLLDSPSIRLRYQWDIAGKVSVQPLYSTSSVRKLSNDINGAEPPEWGAHLIIKGGMINYGPWADRERANLQAILFPNSYRDAQPAVPISPGQWRQSTKLSLKIVFEDETNIRIPTREPSKDWAWKGRADTIEGTTKLNGQNGKRHPRSKEPDKGSHGTDTRPFGWLAFKVDRGSTVDYEMGMFASPAGFTNRLLLDLQGTKVTSSVNHGVLWQSKRQRILCDLSNPLEWNSLHTWSITIDNYDMELFVLRDHMFLFTDLVNDWTTGPFPEFYTFVPFQYNVGLSFTNAELFLNVNDSNVINNPTDTDDNSFLHLGLESVGFNVCIPAVNLKPKRNAVPFELTVTCGTMDYSTPLWNTHRSFIGNPSIASLDKLIMSGNYAFNTLSSPTLTDVLTLNLSGDSLKLCLYGFVVDAFLKIKENYFGEYLHFKTFEEYQGMSNADHRLVSDSGLNQSNGLDVIIQIHGNDCKILFPSNIYDGSDCVLAEASSLDADVRFTNYYMDLQTTFSPLAVSVQSLHSDSFTSNTELFIDGLGIHGHRLFGLPPAEPTYVCNWDFTVGRVVGECSATFVKHITSALRSFAYSIDDEENSLPPLHTAILHDVVFLRARIESIQIWILQDAAAFLFQCGALDLDFNDWAGVNFSDHMNLNIPDITVASVARGPSGRPEQVSNGPIETYACFQTSVLVRMVERKAKFADNRALQQSHVRTHDQLTQRTLWLLLDKKDIGTTEAGGRERQAIAPIHLPPMPPPIRDLLNAADTTCPSSSSESEFRYDGTRGGIKLPSFRYEKTMESEPDVSQHDMSGFSRSNSRNSHLSPSTNYMNAHSRRSISQINMEDDSKRVLADHGRKPASPRKTLASAWAMPNFHFHKVMLDRRNLPLLQSNDTNTEAESIDDDAAMFNADDQNVDITRSYFFVNLMPGLQGFCRPEALFSVVKLFENLLPADPIEVIDDLQSTIISNILSHGKRLSKPRKVLGLNIQLPVGRLRIINNSTLSNDYGETDLKDQFDLETMKMQVLLSGTTEIGEETIKPKHIGLTTNLRANSISFSASTGPIGIENKLVQLRTEDILLSSVLGKSKYSRLQVENIDMLLPSECLRFSASFMQRTNALVSSVTQSIRQIHVSQTDRLQSLIYQLTRYGSQIPDPQFLTRPSYVLRAAEDHLRGHDSWKILSRLRHIHNSLPEEQTQELRMGCMKNSIPRPLDCRSIVLSSFDKWRTWDLAHAKKSHVMKTIWSIDEVDDTDSDKYAPIDISVSIRLICVSMDPPPSSSLVLVEDLSTTVQMSPNLQASTNSPEWSLAMRNYCSNASMELRWELVKLLEENTNIVQDFILQSNSTKHHEISPKSDGSNMFQFLHIVTVAEYASIILDGINLKIALLGNALKNSVTHQIQPGNQPDQSSFLLTSDTGTVELTNRTKSLMALRLIDSNLFISHAFVKKGSGFIHDWKCTTGCRKLRYDMTEEPLGLIHVADRFVEDEIKQIMRVTSRLHASDEGQTQSTKSNNHRFHATAFLDSYHLCLMILPTISYVMAGDVLRLSLSPAQASQFEVDFDLKSITHVLQSSKEGSQRMISSFTIPPINGRVVSSSSEGRPALDVYSTIELIKVDADSVRNILGAISGPEISHFFSDMQHDIQILKKNLNQINYDGRTSSPAKTRSEGIELTYKLRLTLAGINIHSSAPNLRSENSFADMDLSLGVIQINLEHIPSDLDLPQLDINLSQVALNLRRRERGEIRSVGSLNLCAQLTGTSKENEKGDCIRYYHLSSKCFHVDLSPETASMMVDIAAHLQERFKALDMSQELKNLRKLRRIRSRGKELTLQVPTINVGDSCTQGSFFDAIYSVDLSDIQVSWLVSTLVDLPQGKEPEDLVFSVSRIGLATGRRSAARLRIEDLQLQMVPLSGNKRNRSHNSALLPEAIFDVAYFSLGNERRLAFQAAGKVLDIRVTSDFILPASVLQRSLASASESLREAKDRWGTSISLEQKKKAIGPDINQLTSLLVDADFAGAIVSLQGKNVQHAENSATGTASGSGAAKYGPYFQQDAASVATLRAPGITFKVQFENAKVKNPSLNAEIKVAASTNVLHPTVVPLITEITSSVKEVVGDTTQDAGETTSPLVAEKRLIGENDPDTILGRCSLNVGLRICKQEFTLSCQPIARVAATARFDDSYITINTVQSAEQKRFFAILVAFNRIQASIKHVYSSESTANFDIDSIVVSLMNSKHVSSSSGISAILKVNPTRLHINAKQVQDFLLFQEIWMPPDNSPKPQKIEPSSPEGQAYIVQQYQQMASAEAFPWNSTIAIERLDIQLDLGQTLGKAEFAIKDLWLSSKKSSDWEQNLCIGFNTLNVQSTGRLSGFVELSHFKVRTSIEWVDGQHSTYHTPLVQAAIGFRQLQSKVSFEYQPFLVADISSFEFLMYNVRDTAETRSDRLVSILEGGKFQVYCTTLTASQGLGLLQTLQKLVQDKQAAHEASLKEIEKFMRRKSTFTLPSALQQQETSAKSDSSEIKMPISLQTNVVVNLQEIKIGVFPNTFQDTQIFKLEALDAEAQFSVAIEDGNIHSGLGLKLGQLRVALSGINHTAKGILEELSVNEIINRATGSRGGTILKVPRLVATMETWQVPTSNHIDYIFKSSFEGKVDVGWNYSRIAFIRGMWDTHSRALANRLGKPLPQAAVQITGGPTGEDGEYSGQEKITAVVNVPQSRYTYTALEEPVIETPQLRDMGEATPPLEWIGLHRDKLPNITHQIIIVTLMEVAKDVEDAYSKILGS